MQDSNFIFIGPDQLKKLWIQINFYPKMQATQEILRQNVCKMCTGRFGLINGVLIPGGGAYLSPNHPFYDTSAQLVNLTMAANDRGDYFPVSMILIHIIRLQH